MKLKVGEIGAPRARIWLAGVERSVVVEADEERRWAKLYKLDSNGHLVKDSQNNAMLEDFWGEVRIELHPDDVLIRKSEGLST